MQEKHEKKVKMEETPSMSFDFFFCCYGGHGIAGGIKALTYVTCLAQCLKHHGTYEFKKFFLPFPFFSFTDDLVVGNTRAMRKTETRLCSEVINVDAWFQKC